MKIVLHNLYGLKNDHKSYFRKRGDGCFDFTGVEEKASELTKEECEKIKQSEDWYCKMYGASHMTIED